VLRVVLPDDTVRAPVLAQPGPLERLFEDEHFLVVNKPAGVVSHPTFRHPSGSLLNHLLWYARAWPAGSRPSLVGRLDKLTSGAVLVAKTTAAHARLQRTLASARSGKSYLAVVHGPVTRSAGTIDRALQRDPADRRRVVAAAHGGLPSATRFARLDEASVDGPTFALLRCELVTGRMHQVRVHLASEGWPIVGDPKYRPVAVVSTLRSDHAAARFARQALHAWRLSFRHPFTGVPVSVCAPVPEDLRALIRACALIDTSEG
jgi:23S rRNA pseudouridine1911/1915/1917 synthase